MRRLLLLSVAVFLLPLPAAQAISLPFLPSSPVTVEWDHAAALTHQTYSWGDVHLVVAQYDGTIRAAVDKALAARGWQLLPTGGSATVFANGDVQGEAQLVESYGKRGGDWGAGQWSSAGLGTGWKPQFGEATVNALGTAGSHLVVDIFDTASHKLVLRGVMPEDVSGTEKSNTKGLQKGLRTMFKKFRPK